MVMVTLGWYTYRLSGELKHQSGCRFGNKRYFASEIVAFWAMVGSLRVVDRNGHPGRGNVRVSRKLFRTHAGTRGVHLHPKSLYVGQR